MCFGEAIVGNQTSFPPIASERFTACGFSPPTWVFRAMPPKTSIPVESMPVRAQRGDVRRRVVMVRLDDDRAHAGIGGALGSLGGVHPSRERRRVRVHVQIDGTVEQAVDDVAHAATSNVCSP